MRSEKDLADMIKVQIKMEKNTTKKIKELEETRINSVPFSNWFTISLNKVAHQLIEHARIRIPKEC